MIRIVMVQGDVLVEDRKNRYTEMARNGMTLDEKGNYLIATTSSSRAEFMMNGTRLPLPPSSYLRICSGLNRSGKHQEQWKKNAKLFIGKIWARIHNDQWEQTTGNATVGVRG